METLGSVRDLDVLIHAVSAGPALAPADAEDLKGSVLRDLQGPVRRMMDHLDGPEHRELLEALQAAAEVRAEGPAAVAEGPRRILRAVQDVLEGRPASWENAPEEALHDLRKRIKRLRYALEAFRPAFGRPLAETIDRCRDLQEALGAVQDAAAFGGILREFRTFAAGQFLASVRMGAAARRADLPTLWKRALGPRMLGRLAAHLLRRASRPAPPAPEVRAAG